MNSCQEEDKNPFQALSSLILIFSSYPNGRASVSSKIPSSLPIAFSWKNLNGWYLCWWRWVFPCSSTRRLIISCDWHQGNEGNGSWPIAKAHSKTDHSWGSSSFLEDSTFCCFAKMVRPFNVNFWTCARPSYRWFLYSILRPKKAIDSVFRCETWNNWISDFLKA